jgi:dethiobiotin synthetase
MSFAKAGSLAARGIFVTGTDTGIGKTMVSASLIGALNRLGFDACGMKPIETGVAVESLAPGSDGARLIAAARRAVPAELAVPYRLRLPAAPLMASRVEDRPIDLEHIRACFNILAGEHRLVVVEGAGGIAVPVVEGTDMAGLAKLLELPVLIVARAGLGTINHTVLTVEYLRARGLQIMGVVINAKFAGSDDPTVAYNPEMIAELSGVEILFTMPALEDVEPFDRAVDAWIATGAAERILEQLGGITR